MVRSGFGRRLGIDALRLVWLLVIMCVLFVLWLCDWLLVCFSICLPLDFNGGVGFICCVCGVVVFMVCF